MKASRFQNKTVLITGGGTGIGRATALAFGREGARVIVSGRRSGPCLETVRLLTVEGALAYSIPCDITVETDVASLVANVEAKHGAIDAAFLNAGIGASAAVIDQDTESFEQVFRTNCTGLMLCMKYLLRSMYRRKTGAIVNNLSVHSYRPIFERTGAYTASKHAALALTKTAAMEAASHGVRVNGVAPGPIYTDMLVESSEIVGGVEGWSRLIPAQRVGTTDEVASTVLWLSSKEASFVNGSVVNVDGGFLAT